MSLSHPVPREHVHTRSLDIRGYKREDGLWDIEGRITDSKPFGYIVRERGPVAADEPLHDMSLRLTIDTELVVHACETVLDAGPYDICPQSTTNFTDIVGLRIGPGWSRAVKERVGGVLGCTHIVEMLGQIATAALQTLWADHEERLLNSGGPRKRPPTLNSCYGWASDGAMVKEYWSEFYSGD